MMWKLVLVYSDKKVGRAIDFDTYYEVLKWLMDDTGPTPIALSIVQLSK